MWKSHDKNKKITRDRDSRKTDQANGTSCTKPTAIIHSLPISVSTNDSFASHGRRYKKLDITHVTKPIIEHGSVVSSSSKPTFKSTINATIGNNDQSGFVRNDPRSNSSYCSSSVHQNQSLVASTNIARPIIRTSSVFNSLNQRCENEPNVHLTTNTSFPARHSHYDSTGFLYHCDKCQYATISEWSLHFHRYAEHPLDYTTSNSNK